jgi:hypothetical protein
MAWLERGLDIVVLDEKGSWVKETLHIKYYDPSMNILGETTFVTRDGSKGETYLLPVIRGASAIDILSPNIIKCTNNGGATVTQIPGGFRLVDGRKISDPYTISGWTVFLTYKPAEVAGIPWYYIALALGVLGLAGIAGVIAYSEMAKR